VHRGDEINHGKLVVISGYALSQGQFAATVPGTPPPLKKWQSRLIAMAESMDLTGFLMEKRDCQWGRKSGNLAPEEPARLEPYR
jgi:hypothetical protein